MSFRQPHPNKLRIPSSSTSVRMSAEWGRCLILLDTAVVGLIIGGCLTTTEPSNLTDSLLFTGKAEKALLTESSPADSLTVSLSTAGFAA